MRIRLRIIYCKDLIAIPAPGEGSVIVDMPLEPGEYLAGLLVDPPWGIGQLPRMLVAKHLDDEEEGSG